MSRDPQLISSELLSHLSMGAGNTPKGYCAMSRDEAIPQTMNRSHIDEDACVDIDRIGSARSTSATDAGEFSSVDPHRFFFIYTHTDTYLNDYLPLFFPRDTEEIGRGTA